MTKLSHHLTNSLAFVITVATSVQAFSQTTPPLREDEVIRKTKDDCGLIDSKAVSKAYEKYYENVNWGGVCKNGLALGEGAIVPRFKGMPGVAPRPEIRGWAYYGRPFGYVKYENSGKTIMLFYWEGKQANLDFLSDNSPNWPSDSNPLDLNPETGKTIVGIGDNLTLLQSNRSRCDHYFYGKLPDCSLDKPYPVFYLGVHPKNGVEKRILCPNPRSPKGCDDLWYEFANPIFEQQKAFVAENAPKAEALQRELQPLIAKEQAAALKLAQQREAEEKRRAAAEALVKANEEKSFKQTLEKGNAGQLFSLADKLALEGQTEKARDAQRALVSRFPNSPLAATAAQQMAASNKAGMVQANAQSGTINSSVSQSGGMGKTTPSGRPFEDCKAEENSSGLAQKLNQIPSNDLNRKLRGIIVSLDFLIATYQKCLPDPRAKESIDSFKASRASSLQNCRQISTVDNCLSSPFEPTASVSPMVTNNPPRGSHNAPPDEVCAANGKLEPCPGSAGNSPDCPRGQNMVNGRCRTGVAQ